MKNAKREFLNALDTFVSHSRLQAFDDFLHFCLYCFDIDKEKKEYKILLARYTENERRSFIKMLSLLGELSENGGQGFYDFLGEFFQEHFSSDRMGQFFTPPAVNDLMAKITIKEGNDQKTVNDCACGSGGCLLAAAKINRHILFSGADIDLTCVRMTVINMLINSLDADILWGDSILVDYSHRFRSRTCLIEGKYFPYLEVTNLKQLPKPEEKEAEKPLQEEAEKPHNFKSRLKRPTSRQASA